MINKRFKMAESIGTVTHTHTHKYFIKKEIKMQKE